MWMKCFTRVTLSQAGARVKSKGRTEQSRLFSNDQSAWLRERRNISHYGFDIDRGRRAACCLASREESTFLNESMIWSNDNCTKGLERLRDYGVRYRHGTGGFNGSKISEIQGDIDDAEKCRRNRETLIFFISTSLLLLISSRFNSFFEFYMKVVTPVRTFISEERMHLKFIKSHLKAIFW